MNYIIRQQIFMQIHISENITVQIGLRQKIILLATYCGNTILLIFHIFFCGFSVKFSINLHIT